MDDLALEIDLEERRGGDFVIAEAIRAGQEACEPSGSLMATVMWLRMPDYPSDLSAPATLCIRSESETLTLVPVHVREQAVRRCELDAGLLLRDRKLAQDALLEPDSANDFV